MAKKPAEGPKACKCPKKHHVPSYRLNQLEEDKTHLVAQYNCTSCGSGWSVDKGEMTKEEFKDFVDELTKPKPKQAVPETPPPATPPT